MRIWMKNLSSDLETGIKGYQYALGTTYSNPTNVREWPSFVDFVIADTIRDRVPTLRGLKNLNHGCHYYIAVRAINGYGTHSDYYVRDFVVDTVPPPPPTLNSFTYKRDTLILDITVYEDDGSELEVVQLSIGSNRGRENILQSRSIGTTTGHRKYIQPIHLISGRQYWLCLKARDKAGLWSENWIRIVP